MKPRRPSIGRMKPGSDRSNVPTIAVNSFIATCSSSRFQDVMSSRVWTDDITDVLHANSTQRVEVVKVEYSTQVSRDSSFNSRCFEQVKLTCI